MKNHGLSGSNIYPRLEPRTSLKQRRFVIRSTAKLARKTCDLITRGKVDLYGIVRTSNLPYLNKISVFLPWILNFWVITPSGFVGGYCCFGRTYGQNFHC